MRYHPRDTVEAYSSAKKPLDHMWYDVHYFQQKRHDVKDSDKRLSDLRTSITPSKKQRQMFTDTIRRRYEALALLQSYARVVILEGKPAGSFIHGLGAGHVREMSLTLHPLYGVPYIPGSSVKGVVRHWALQAFFIGNECAWTAALEGKGENTQAAFVMADLFGTEERQGIVQFHDVFPCGRYRLKPDVITVHYGDYYGKKKAATDDQSPVPNNFYTIEADSMEFVLTQLYDRKKKQSKLTGEELLDVAKTWLQLALTETGIGGKTSSGYGFFHQFTERTEVLLGPVKEELIRRKIKIKKIQEEQRKQEEEDRKEEALSAKIAKMSDAERLAYEISQLSASQQDQEASKSTLYEQVLAFAEEGDLAPAQSLKHYWQRIGSWKVKKQSKKQFEKVSMIKKILEVEE